MNSKLFLIANLLSCAAASTSTNVVGNATQVKFSDAPWMVSLQVDEGDYAYCGATLIRSFNRTKNATDIDGLCYGWVITAASCMNGVIDPVFTLGNINLKTKNESIEINLGVEENFINDTLHITNTSTHGNDLALLFVTFDISENASIHYETKNCYEMPVLPYESKYSINETFFETMNASIYGWGLLDDNGPLQNDLYSTPLRLRSDKNCTDEMGHGAYNSTTMLCAGGALSTVGPYNGPNSYDTGGPLVCQYETKENETMMVQNKYLCGVTSFRPLDGEKRLPAVFMDIANFARWINDTITNKEKLILGDE